MSDSSLSPSDQITALTAEVARLTTELAEEVAAREQVQLFAILGIALAGGTLTIPLALIAQMPPNQLELLPDEVPHALTARVVQFDAAGVRHLVRLTLPPSRDGMPTAPRESRTKSGLILSR